MEIRFRSESYKRLEVDAYFTDGWPPALVKEYRFCLHYLRQAIDRRDLAALKCLEFHQLDGDRRHQYSLYLNDEWRLIVEIEGIALNQIVVIVNIEETS